MKRGLKFVLLMALGAGTLSMSATAQQRELGSVEGAQWQHATFDPTQAGLNQAGLEQAAWNDHRRCDGDHDRDDRGCYYRDQYGRWQYRGNVYYGNGYYAGPRYATPYYAPRGWYDERGRWHAYDKDRDHRRHDDDDRR